MPDSPLQPREPFDVNKADFSFTPCLATQSTYALEAKTLQ